MSLPLNVESRGAGGRPVLFVHSLAGDLSHWNAQLEHLRARRRSVAFDLSGHGASPAAIGRYTIEELAKDVGFVADSLGLERIALVGHGVGALIATEYARTHPGRVELLGLVDAPPAPGAWSAGDLQRIRAGLVHAPLATVEQMWAQRAFVGAKLPVREKIAGSLRRLPRAMVAELTEAALTYDATVGLRAFRGSKFAIVTPDNDTPLSLHNVVPGFQHTVIKNTGHWIQLDDPARFNAVLDVFLAAL
jgi:3-oxoadipate enol-lactonase